MDQALGESGYEAAILAEYLGARKRANVRKLVRQARKFDDAGLSLADFVTRLRADLRKPPREEQAATTDEAGEAVRIMSIHQAKGLEFPVVVMPDLDRKPPATHQKVAFDKGLGMVVKPAGDHEDNDDQDQSSDSALSLGWTTYRAIEQDEEEREALRVLYVAATRARERLILSAGVAVDSKPVSPSLRLLDSRFDRSTGECLAVLPPGLTPPRARVIVDPPPQPQPRSNAGGRKRPRLLAVAREIERGIERSQLIPVETHPPSQATFRGFAFDPAAGLSPDRANLLKAIQCALEDPEVFRQERRGEVLEKAYRKLIPLPSKRTQALATRAVSNLLRGEFGRGLSGSVEVRRNVSWSLLWSGSDGGPTMLEGRIELVCRDHAGNWRLVAITDASAPVDRERLRLALSARALGVDPIVRLWLLRVHPEGTITRHDEPVQDEAGLANRIAMML
ncbi:MAG TPA: 3'-5' exonuclease, partial [Isosphaeraceae bacterium]|nr:3'-5' exonuclease [Isosphaeraceae bacterium]